MHFTVSLLVTVTVRPLEAETDIDCEDPFASEDGWVKVIVCVALLIVMLRALEVAAAFVVPAEIVTVTVQVPAATIVTTPPEVRVQIESVDPE